MIPEYTEASLFLTALTFVLLASTNEEIIRILVGFTVDLRGFLLIFFFLLGIIFSFYYALSSRRTPRFAKIFMLGFATFTNFEIAVYAFSYIEKNVHDLYIIFPAINLLNAIVMLILLRIDVIDETCVSDENARRINLVIGSSAVIAIFFASQYLLKNYWAITFSICLSYTLLVNNMVTAFFRNNGTQSLRDVNQDKEVKERIQTRHRVDRNKGKP